MVSTTTLTRPTGIAVLASVGLMAGLLAAFPSSSEPTPGHLYLTSVVHDEIAFADCASSFVYGLAAAPPADAAGGKAYAGRSLGPVACETVFEYNVTSPFALAEVAKIHFWMGCDLVAPTVGVEGATVSLRIELTKFEAETEEETSLSGSIEWTSPLPVCNQEEWEVEVDAATDDAAFVEEDKLNIRILLFGLNTEPAVQENVYFVVDRLDAPSGIEAIGLPNAGPDGEESSSSTTTDDGEEETTTTTGRNSNSDSNSESSDDSDESTDSDSGGGAKDAGDTPGLGVVAVLAAASLIVVALRRKR